MENFDFIGENYETEDKKQKILESYDEYQISKLRYLNNTKFPERTKKAYWGHSKKFHSAEKIYGRDLKNFTKEEIENVFRELVHLSPDTVKVIATFCNNYLEYCVSKDEIEANTYTDIKITELNFKISYQTLEEFFEDIYELDCTDVDRAMITLLRYGVKIDNSGSIKWEDVDREKMVLTIHEKDKVLKLPITKQFLMIIDNAKKCNIGMLHGKETPYLEYGYIIKLLKPSDLGYMEVGDIHNKITNLYKRNKLKKINVKNLVKHRIYDLLFEKLEENKKENINNISNDDIGEVLRLIQGESKYGDVFKWNHSFKILSDTKVNYKTREPNKRTKTREKKSEKLPRNIDEPIIINNFIDQEDSAYQNEILDAFNDINDSDVSNYEFKEREKKHLGANNIKGRYPRDNKIGALALKLANYECIFDKEHKYFISNTTSRNYVEAHHIIPMKYYDDFTKSIDNEANIVALCPICHRCLHYGKFEDKKILLKRLYDEHIKNLIKVGLGLKADGTKFKEDDLINMYRNC